MHWKLVEKDDHTANHGLFDSLASAERHIREVLPSYVGKGYFMNKALTADCFCIVAPTGEVVEVDAPPAPPRLTEEQWYNVDAHFKIYSYPDAVIWRYIRRLAKELDVIIRYQGNQGSQVIPDLYHLVNNGNSYESTHELWNDLFEQYLDKAKEQNP
jgi:hypothetical protein